MRNSVTLDGYDLPEQGSLFGVQLAVHVHVKFRGNPLGSLSTTAYAQAMQWTFLRELYTISILTFWNPTTQFSTVFSV